jgi:hypothetical protein
MTPAILELRAGGRVFSVCPRHLYEVSDSAEILAYELRPLPVTDAPRALVTSVRIARGPGHDRVSVWNRGGLSGELVVRAGDGVGLAIRLLSPTR